MAATLTKAMLDDLHKGCASIRLIAQTNDITTADFSAADQIFTLKDTFSVNQGEPTVNEIKIDQGDKTILTDVDTAEFNMSGDIPSAAKELFDYFYATNSGTAAVKVSVKVNSSAAADFEGYGYSTAPKITNATVLAESASGKTAVAFMNVQFVVNYVDDDQSNPQRVHFIGTILGNTGSGEDFYILKQGVSE